MPKNIRAQRHTGVAEADQSYFRRSAKGQRQALLRKARKRAGQPSQRSRSQKLVPVLVARDRAGQSADFILEAEHAKHASDQLRPLMAKDAILCAEGDATMRATARKLGIEHPAVNVLAGMRVSMAPGMCRTSTLTKAV